MTIETSLTAKELSDLVRAYRVVYEVVPEFLMIDGERRKVGYNLDLCGTLQYTEEHMHPGCTHCVRAYRALREVAARVLPTEKRASRYEIEPFEPAWRFPPVRGFRKEILLEVKILHRHGFDRPVDACQDRCLHEMTEALRALGVQEGRWRETGGASAEGAA